MATAAAKATAALCLALLLILQSCHVLHANIDPDSLPDAYVTIASLGFRGYYLALDCVKLTVKLERASLPPNPERCRFQFTAIEGEPLSYNIQSAQCPENYIFLDASGGDAFGAYSSGFGSVSITQDPSDPGAQFRPVPQLSSRVPKNQQSYALLSNAVSYAYFRPSLSRVLNAQNYIGPWEQLNIDEFPL